MLCDEKLKKVILNKEAKKVLINPKRANKFVQILNTENWVVVNKIPVTVNGVLVTVGNQIFAD